MNKNEMNVNENAAVMGFSADIFRKAAQEVTTLSTLLVDRVKLSMEEVMERFPDGVTITEFDFITTEDPKTGDESTYPVCVFKEDPAACFFGGIVMTRLCNRWVALGGGDVETASNALKTVGGVKVRFEKGRTRSGNNITKVTVI